MGMTKQHCRAEPGPWSTAIRRFARLLLLVLVPTYLGVSGASAAPPMMVTPGQFGVSSTGAATYNIPIAPPPGTSGVVPSLSLAYSSQNGDGFVGLGWSLTGLSSITRCPRTLAQDSVHGSVNYDSGDRFCMDGQRLMLISGTYGADGSQYRTEIESFSKIIAHGSSGSGPSWFEVRTKSGQIMEFGNTSDSKVMVIAVVGGTPPANTVREWMVNKISDVMTNYMSVTYSCEPISGGSCVSGIAYPTRIDYTGNSSSGTSPYNSVRFTYAARGDSAPMYQAGGVVTLTAVLNNIKTYQSTTVVQDYQLAYRAGTSVLRSHLNSVTQCDGASHCLPATTFGWQGTTSTTYSSVSSSLTVYSLVVPGDWNGDGLTDYSLMGSCIPTSYPVYVGGQTFGFSSSAYTLQMPGMQSGNPFCTGPDLLSTMLAPDGTSDLMVSLKQSVGFVTTTYVALLTSAGSTLVANYNSASLTLSYRAGDFNGDGKIDFFNVQNPTSYAYLGNTAGTTFTADGGINLPSPTTAQVFGADFDGDGCTDLFSKSGAGNAMYYAYNCNPAASSVSSPYLAAGTETLGDFNGDGKTDIIDPGAGSPILWLSTGTGFVQASGSMPTGSIVSVGDWNGDARADILVDPSSLGTSDLVLYLSTGTGFTSAATISGSAGGGAVAADWDNNGNTDVLIQLPMGGGDSFSLIDYTPELMVSVSNGIGATTTIAYDRINKGSSFYTKGSSSYPTQDMIGPQYVVKQVNASNGLGTCTPPATTNCYATTYAYAGAKKDLEGRGFLGFSTVTATDPQTSIVTTTNYSTSFPYIGLVTSETKVRSSVTLSSVTNTYTNNSGCGVTPAASGVVIDCLSTMAVSGHDLNGATLPSTTTNYTYDNYGNALTVSISVSDGSSKNTTNTYSNDTTNWFLGRMLTTSVNSIVGSSNLTRQSSFAYSSTTGLLTQESIEPGVSTCNSGSSSCTLTTSYTYDAFGHRITTTISGTGVTSRTSYAFYDSNGQFMTSAANALGQYEFWAYDARFGTPTSHTGPNFLTTSWTYDYFGRPTQEIRPDNTQTNTSYSYCSGSCPTYGQFYVRSEVDGPSGSPQVGPIGYAYFDMLSRGIANDTQGFDASYIRVATQYDTNGRVQQSSRPYFTASASPKWTQFAYDDLGRVTTATFPDSSVTTYGYNGLTTTVTNNLSQTTTTVKNAQGLNATVTDATSHSMSYVYNAFGDLLTVTDPNGNVITNTFDIRGNKTVSVDPDMGRWTYAYDVLAELTSQTDAKSQTTTLAYDVLGRALTRTDNGLYSAWTYGTSAANHNVGQVIEAKACPTSACSSIDSDKTYLFDGVGRQSQYTLQTPTDYYAYATTYNSSNGQIASVRYPSGFTVNRTYNTTGFLTQLTESGGAPVWAINSRDAELHITSQTAGNNVITTQSFDANTGLIQNQRAGGGSVASFDYAFDTIGNLTTRTDNSQPYTERFCYDSLNRLTNDNIGAACTGGTTVAYDFIGNITSKTGTGTYSYSGTRPHAVSGITGTIDGLTNPSYSYDANGNLTCTSTGSGCSGTIGRMVNLTSFNMALSIGQGTNSLSITYDDQHQRLQQTNTVSGTATTKTVYLNDVVSGVMSERVTASGTTPTVWNSFNWNGAPWGGTTANALPTWTDYITIDGQIVAQRKVTYPLASAWGLQNWNGFNWGTPAGSLWGSSAGANPPRFRWGTDPWSGNVVAWNYFNLDHLGSVAVITDQGGNVLQRLSFDAWGKARNANGTSANCGTITSTTTKGFTNQEQMPTQCLVNLNARLYDSSIGKFMAADTFVPDLYDGQAFNSYSYVANNPLSFTDPTGHFYNRGNFQAGPGLVDGNYNLETGRTNSNTTSSLQPKTVDPSQTGTPIGQPGVGNQQDKTKGFGGAPQAVPDSRQTFGNASDAARNAQGDPGEVVVVPAFRLAPLQGPSVDAGGGGFEQTAASIPSNPPFRIPGGPYAPAGAGQPPGTFYGPKQERGPRPTVRWVPSESQGGPPGSRGYWKSQMPGQNGSQRYSQTGQQLTPEEAHPGPSTGQRMLGWASRFGRVVAGRVIFLFTLFDSGPAE